MGFVDEAVITVRSGDGGKGCVSFRRERFIPKGGPDGGDGGDGGCIIARAKANLRSLADYNTRKYRKARNGLPGKGKNQTGGKGDDLILELRESLGSTIVIVTHELASIFAIGNNSVFLDPDTKTMIAGGNPRQLLQETQDPKVRAFLTRGEQ